MPIKDQNNLTIVRAAAGKLIPENEGVILTPNTIPSESSGTVSAPKDLSTEAAGQLSAPNNLTSVPEIRVGGAAILCSTELERNTIVDVTSAATNPEYVLNKNTYERMVFGSNVGGEPSVTFDFDTPFLADTITISAHNIGSTGGRIRVSSNGPSGFVQWTDPRAVSARNHTVVVKIEQPVLLDTLIFSVTKDFGYEVFVGNIMMGLRVDLPPIYGGHMPATLNRTTQYESNTTGTGNWVGRSIKKRGYGTSFSFQHIDPLFARNVLSPLLDCMEGSPFVIQWRPDKFPSEVIYCWTTDDPQLSDMGGGHDLMQMSFNVEAYRGL